jgi:hypothetical protein
MQENNPIPCHGKREMSLVAARLDFPSFPKHWSHSRVRHVRLERDVRSAYYVGGRISLPERNHHWARPGWLR